MYFGARRIFTVSCSSSALRSLSRPSPSTWPKDAALRLRAGAPSCATTRQTSRPWTCSWFRPSALTFYVLVIVRLARRELVWINVTSHPTAEWIAQQITEAFPWSEAPRSLIRDQDGIYGAAVARRQSLPRAAGCYATTIQFFRELREAMRQRASIREYC